jgi:hypothetical protein
METGFANAQSVTATVGGHPAPVTRFGAQGAIPGWTR